MPVSDNEKLDELRIAYSNYLYREYGQEKKESIQNNSILYLAKEDYAFDSFRNYEYVVEVYYNIRSKITVTIISNENITVSVVKSFSYGEMISKLDVYNFDNWISKDFHGVNLDDMSELIDCTLRGEKQGINKILERYKNIANIII